MPTPSARELRGQPLHRHLTLVVLGEHEAAQVRAEMSDDTGWQWRQHRLPVRRRPAFATVTDDPGLQHQLLHDERLVALEARPRRRRRLHHPILDADPRSRLAAPAMLARSRRLRRRGSVHAARLDVSVCPRTP